MIEFIKYQQINETVPCADINTVYTPLDKPTWCNFTDMSVSRNHVIALFSNSKILVCAKDGDTYVTNSEEMRKTYRKGGHKAVLWRDLTGSERAIGEVGLVG